MYNEDDVVCPVSILNALVFRQQNLVAAEVESKNINGKMMWKKQNDMVQGNSVQKTVTRIFEILQKKAFCEKKYSMQKNSKPDDGVINKINKKNNEKWIVGVANKLFYGKNREQHVAELLVGKYKVERAIQHLYLLELSCDINK